MRVTNWMNLGANLSLSENKIRNFTEYIDDYDNGGQQTKFYRKTDISFSPSAIGGASVTFIPVKNTEINLISKYVGRQYLDNTAQQSRSLDPYWVTDCRAIYTWKGKKTERTEYYRSIE